MRARGQCAFGEQKGLLDFCVTIYTNPKAAFLTYGYRQSESHVLKTQLQTKFIAEFKNAAIGQIKKKKKI